MGDTFLEFKEVLFALIQAILNTRFYGPDHPKGKESYETLVIRLRGWKKNNPDTPVIFSFNGKEFFIGFGENFSSLPKVLSKVEMEIYGQKLFDYFSRARLISLHLDPELVPDELKGLLLILNKFYRGEISLKESISRQVQKFFVQYRIQHISTLFDEDIITVERNLPWKIKVIISRLNKDLKHLPIFHDNKEKLKQAKLLIFRENIKALSSAEEIYIFLVNLDLIKEIYSAKEEYFNFTIDSVRVEIIYSFFTLLTKNPESQNNSVIIELLPIFLRRIVEKGNEEKNIKLFSSLLKSGLLNENTIPSDILRKIRMEEKAVKFLSEPETLISIWLKNINAPSTKEEIQSVGELIATRGETKSLYKLISRFGEILDIETLLKIFLTSVRDLPPERISDLCKIIEICGEKCVEIALWILKENFSQKLKINILNPLSRIIKEDPQILLKEINNHPQSPEYTFYLLKLATNVSSSEMGKEIERHLYHSDINTKKEALNALLYSNYSGALPTLLRFWESNIPENIELLFKKLILTRNYSKWLLKKILPVYEKRWKNFDVEERKIKAETEYISGAIKEKRIDAEILKGVTRIIANEGKKKNPLRPIGRHRKELLSLLLTSMCNLPAGDKKILLRYFTKEKIDNDLLKIIKNCVGEEKKS